MATRGRLVLLAILFATALAQESKPIDWHQGMRVKSVWPGDGRWYSGTIAKIHGLDDDDRFFVIAFDDGDRLENATAETTVPLPQDAPPPPPPPPAPSGSQLHTQYLRSITNENPDGNPQRREAAYRYYSQVAAAKPDNHEAKMLSRILAPASAPGQLDDDDIPDSLVAASVKQEFDAFGKDFDSIMTRVRCLIPAMVGEALRLDAISASEQGLETRGVPRSPAPPYETELMNSQRSLVAAAAPFWAPGIWQLPGGLRALDIGSGTGRCGLALHQLASQPSRDQNGVYKGRFDKIVADSAGEQQQQQQQQQQHKHLELSGADLSIGMLREATKLGIYDRLFGGHVLNFIAIDNNGAALDEGLAPSALVPPLPGSRLFQYYHLVTACDCMIYMPLADLKGVFRHVSAVLHPGGRFAFTVEEIQPGEEATALSAFKGRQIPVAAMAGDQGEAAAAASEEDEEDGEARRGGIVLRKTGRYAHSSSFIRRQLAAAGMVVRAEHRVVLRWEWLRPEMGLVFVAGKEKAEEE